MAAEAIGAGHDACYYDRVDGNQERLMKSTRRLGLCASVFVGIVDLTACDTDDVLIHDWITVSATLIFRLQGW